MAATIRCAEDKLIARDTDNRILKYPKHMRSIAQQGDKDTSKHANIHAIH